MRTGTDVHMETLLVDGLQEVLEELPALLGRAEEGWELNPTMPVYQKPASAKKGGSKAGQNRKQPEKQPDKPAGQEKPAEPEKPPEPQPTMNPLF